MATLPESRTPYLLQTINWVFDPMGYAEHNFQAMGDVFDVKLPPVTSKQSLAFLNHPEAVHLR
ncbi:MAG: hypothetical protein AAFQ89_14810 [Cyanobacteria bacterium J06626_18]